MALVSEIAPHPMRPEEALELVGLGNRLDHFPAQLSGGEQQRVAIARAVAKRPEIMLCDEPTGALDSKTGILVLEALASTNRELGTTTAIITHNVSIGAIGDRVFRFTDGRIAGIDDQRAPARCQPRSPGERDARARPQARPRPPAPVGAVAGRSRWSWPAASPR